MTHRLTADMAMTAAMKDKHNIRNQAGLAVPLRYRTSLAGMRESMTGIRIVKTS